MAWETRRDSRQPRYYTRSRREDGQVVRDYFGSGFAAEAAALLEAFRREDAARERVQRRREQAENERQRRAEKERERAEQQRLDALEWEVDAFCHQVEQILRQTLEAAGYYRHDRGQWRKRPGRPAKRREENGDG